MFAYERFYDEPFHGANLLPVKRSLILMVETANDLE